jgi:hypothetical protein
MKLIIQCVAANTNKTVAIVVKLSEHSLGHEHTVWMDNSSPDLTLFLKVKKGTVLDLYVLTGKMFHLWRRTRHCRKESTGQNSGEVAVLAWYSKYKKGINQYLQTIKMKCMWVKIKLIKKKCSLGL